MNTKFKEPNNTAVFTTKYVVEDKKDITMVFHFAEDGAWQFSSNDPETNYEEVARVVGLGEIIAIDETVLQIADLPLGYAAQRKFKNDVWKIAPMAEQFQTETLPLIASNIFDVTFGYVENLLISRVEKPING